jgi:hypothetical protein
MGKTVCWVSPVPRSPTTIPYPMSWLSRMPSIEATSLIRVRCAADSGETASPYPGRTVFEAKEAEAAGGDGEVAGRIPADGATVTRAGGLACPVV